MKEKTLVHSSKVKLDTEGGTTWVIPVECCGPGMAHPVQIAREESHAVSPQHAILMSCYHLEGRNVCTVCSALIDIRCTDVSAYGDYRVADLSVTWPSVLERLAEIAEWTKRE